MYSTWKLSKAVYGLPAQSKMGLPVFGGLNLDGCQLFFFVKDLPVVNAGVKYWFDFHWILIVSLNMNFNSTLWTDPKQFYMITASVLFTAFYNNFSFPFSFTFKPEWKETGQDLYVLLYNLVLLLHLSMWVSRVFLITSIIGVMF